MAVPLMTSPVGLSKILSNIPEFPKVIRTNHRYYNPLKQPWRRLHTLVNTSVRDTRFCIRHLNAENGRYTLLQYIASGFCKIIRQLQSTLPAFNQEETCVWGISFELIAKCLTAAILFVPSLQLPPWFKPYASPSIRPSIRSLCPVQNQIDSFNWKRACWTAMINGLDGEGRLIKVAIAGVG